MRIEVITDEETSKAKGDLLESLASDFMQTQGFSITKQVRLTACEIDILCTHEVSGKTIYVECKAHRDTLSASVLKNLLGTVEFRDYAEGWLISTGPLGKDANGFMVEWEQKTDEKRQKLSIYHPQRVVSALIKAGLIRAEPDACVEDHVGANRTAGEWTLIISPWGRYWTCPTLEAGVPVGAIVFNAKTTARIDDVRLLARIKATDISLHELEFIIPPVNTEPERGTEQAKRPAVVEVECGEKWTDYRPARPEHFVGRTRAQRAILRFLTDVKKRRTTSRVFAVKGDSGIGKSSLIAKLRATANVSKKPSNLFLYAVDVRAANDSSYVYASLLTAFRAARDAGIACSDAPLEISNYADPLQSESIRAFLQECEKKHELVILVFDQFEELYSKPDLFPVFDEVRKLMFSTLGASTNFVLGFAWKTDNTVPQDHPAYHMWHELADHRYETTLSPFTHADAENSIRLFETELNERVRPELRRYLMEHSQGYPWLLKKLCIHLYQQLQTGASQSLLADRSLDIAALFDRDLGDLTQPQMACVKLVAEHAPMDWYEVLETASGDVVQTLQNKRILIRRGDKLNLYWDIFKDYVLTGSIPSIPFTYIPQAPSVGALLKVALQLDPAEARDLQTLSKISELSENTVRNIVHDLIEFGIADVTGDVVRLDAHIKELTARGILSRMRVVFRRHALTSMLRENNAATPASQAQVVAYLKSFNPTAQHHSRTWKTYANKMCHWLHTLGYVEARGDRFVFSDQGEIGREHSNQFRGERRRVVFIGDAPPSRTVEALTDLMLRGPQSTVKMRSKAYRNACAVLFRFRLVEITPAHEYKIVDGVLDGRSPAEAVYEEASEEDAIKLAVQFLRENPNASPYKLGRMIAEKFSRDWTKASCVRVGNSLRQWGGWFLASRGADGIPEPPGRTCEVTDPHNDTPDLFGPIIETSCSSPAGVD